MIDVANLRSIHAPLFAGFDSADLAVVASALVREAMPAGSVIVRRGDPGRDLFVVVEGRIRLSRNEHDLGTLSPGAYFGEISLIGGRERAATAEALGDVMLCRLPYAEWARLLVDQPRTAAELLRRLAERLGDQLIGMTDSVELLFDRKHLGRAATYGVELVLGDRVEQLTVPSGTLLAGLLPPQVGGAPVVAAMAGARPVTLSTPVLGHLRIELLTLRHWEGREVWRRSVGLLFLAAAHRVAPSASFSLSHSVGGGRVVRLRQGSIDDELRGAIEDEMRRIVRANVAFVREQWPLEQARVHFAARGEADAVAALATHCGPVATVIGLEGRYAHATGPVAPSTGMLVGSHLHLHPEGLLLEYGATFQPWLETADDDVVEREIAHPRFVSPMAQDHERWLRAMGVDSVGAFNAFCINGRDKEIIHNAEGFHEKHIGCIADAISVRGDGVRVIAIAGPSSSGKTTFIKRLTVQLEVNGVRPVALSLDDYFVDREQCPRDEQGDYDFEVLQALDTRLLQDHLARLLAGETVATAHFDFKSGRSSPSGGPQMKLQKAEVLLIEGIHGLNPALIGAAVPAGQMFRIFVQPALCLPFDVLTSVMPADLRFLRRIVRDRHARGTRAADNILRWPSVRRGEGRHIFPHKHHADAVFDTSLAYEMGVLKVYGERYLLEVPPSHPAASTAFRLRGLLDNFVSIYPDHVPPTSILREFIGGSDVEY
ncbi:MAG: cyclic nucleotide-binding domain-containing protein [Deltaproteobacteria bacterium]|nr:cyclic nucleotide-binding domain-containing protein [Deltaproteobacteria bacterium]